jgi:hypothetical protein
MTWKNSVTALLIISYLCITTSCAVNYGFQGTSTTAKTLAIEEFYNNTELGPANLGQTFTNKLKDYFIQNTNISIVQSNGELTLEGVITDYRITPIAPVSNGDDRNTTASSTRLTITVKANYINTLQEEMSFKDKSFSFFKDFSNDQNLADIEESLIRQIFEQISLDIFNASVANW